MFIQSNITTACFLVCPSFSVSYGSIMTPGLPCSAARFRRCHEVFLVGFGVLHRLFCHLLFAVIAKPGYGLVERKPVGPAYFMLHGLFDLAYASGRILHQKKTHDLEYL